MTIPNRITLEQALNMPLGELVACNFPTQHIAFLLEDVAALKARVKVAEAVLFGIMDQRFAHKAKAMRLAESKDTGTVRFEDDDMTVIADLPKKVEWSQAGLRTVLEVIKGWVGEDPAEYIATELSVAEKKFTAWPSTIQKLFTPHRKVSAGKATYKLEAKEAA